MDSSQIFQSQSSMPMSFGGKSRDIQKKPEINLDYDTTLEVLDFENRFIKFERLSGEALAEAGGQSSWVRLSLVLSIILTKTQWARKFKKVQAKKLLNSNKSIS